MCVLFAATQRCNNGASQSASVLLREKTVYYFTILWCVRQNNRIATETAAIIMRELGIFSPFLNWESSGRFFSLATFKFLQSHKMEQLAESKRMYQVKCLICTKKTTHNKLIQSERERERARDREREKEIHTWDNNPWIHISANSLIKLYERRMGEIAS